MNTKLNHQMKINPKYEELFALDTKEDKYQHNAEMISFRILSELEHFCNIHNIKKSELAKRINCSRSYITQLYRGDKQVNTLLLGKLEEEFNFSLEIKIKSNSETIEEHYAKQLPHDFFKMNRRFIKEGCVMYCFKGNKPNDSTERIIESIHTENKSKQKAV